MGNERTQKTTLSFQEALISAGNKVIQFSGRSRRSEYWWTMAVVIVISFILPSFLSFCLYLATIPLTFRRLHDTGRSGWWWGVGAILQSLFIIWAVCDIFLEAMNMMSNDYNISSLSALIVKYWLLSLLIIAYKIMLLVFLCMDSEPDENEYGESPKYVITDDNI